MPKTITFLAISLVLFIVSKSVAQETEIIFEGIPTKRIISGVDGAKESQINGKQKDEYRVLITKRGEQYFWSTRENKEVFPTISGIFLIFISPGSGYIKISTSTKEYFEHMSQGLTTYTYWGNAVKLDLR